MGNHEASEAELRARFGPNVVLGSKLPSAQELASTGTFLERVGRAFGYDKWMLKTLAGVALMVFVVPANFYGALDFWDRQITATYEAAPRYLAMMKAGMARPSDRLVGFGSTSLNSTTENADFQVPLILAAAPALLPSPVFGPVFDLIVYRLTDPRWFPIPRGPRPFKSRWASAGAEVLYAAADPLTAIKEINMSLAEISGPHSKLARPPLTLNRLRLSGTMEVVPGDLPETEQHRRDFGDAWLKEGRSSLLATPFMDGIERPLYVANLRHPALIISFDDAIPNLT